VTKVTKVTMGTMGTMGTLAVVSKDGYNSGSGKDRDDLG